MREIKFRAWDRRAKRMFSPCLIGINDCHGVYTNRVGDHWSLDGTYPENLELMEYTGLKDKKGLEIYEGDIIEYQPTYRYIPCVVEIFDGSVWLLSLPDRQGVNTLTQEAIEKYRLVIRGNIYENASPHELSH